MIKTRKELKEYISKDRNNYPCLSTKLKTFYAFLCHDRDYFVFRYIKLLRLTEYYDYRRKKNKLFLPVYILIKSKKNKLGQRLHLDFGENAFDKGLYIAHAGIIVGSSKIGKNCKLHGQNCIGSNVELGDNCELWVGAKIIGPCKLGNNVTVAAGAVVVDCFEEDGIVLAGVPAKIVKRVQY